MERKSNIFKKYLLASCFVTLSCTVNTRAMQRSEPLRELDYVKIGALKHIQTKYRPLMKQLGCLDNVTENSTQTVERQRISSQTLESYQEECLAHLASIRRDALLRPVYEAGTMIVLLCAATAAILYHQGLYSCGGSFGASSAVYKGLFQLKDGITALHHWLKPPSHPVDEHEKRYVMNQCFIPRQLWPYITEKLMTARQNPFEQRNALHFLSFALGLTLHKQTASPIIRMPRGEIDPSQVIARRVNEFFSDYESFTRPLDRSTLRNNVKTFIQNLTGKGERPRPIFFYGDGGVGKTFFAKKLVEWISEIFPGRISYDPLNITSPAELEGDGTQPGAFLRVLRNICTQGTRGSVVMMDEAIWLNSPEFEAPAKRTFNGTVSSLSTCYFGKGADGQDISLPMPSMLILAAANSPIEEATLKGRFDSIEFPLPKREILRNYAVSLFEQHTSRSIRKPEKQALLRDISQWRTFRDVEAVVPALIDFLEEGLVQHQMQQHRDQRQH